jgi:hypothetical protein
MLSIKQLYNKYFKKNIETKTDNRNIDFFDDSVLLSFGLTPNYEIDLSLEIKDLLIKDKNDLEFKAQKLAAFFHTIVSGGLNNIIVEFLMKEMSDEQNKKLFEEIVYNWLLLEKAHILKNKNQSKNLSDPVVSPLKVFSQYIPNNK